MDHMDHMILNCHMDPQLPLEVLEMMNFVAPLNLVALSDKQKKCLLLAISALYFKQNPCFRTIRYHSTVEDVDWFM